MPNRSKPRLTTKMTMQVLKKTLFGLSGLFGTLLTAGIARGQTIFCPEGHHNSEDPEWVDLPIHSVCSAIDGPGFLKLYREALFRAAGPVG